MLERMYILTYAGDRGRCKRSARFIALDQMGFVVLDINGEYIFVPK